MTYREMRAEQQARVNDFLSEYAFFAFSDDQFRAGVDKLQTDDLVKIPGGGFVRKDKKDDFIALMDRHAQELREALEDPETAYQAFVAEIADHECGYTGDLTEALEALGLTTQDVKSNEMLFAALQRAVRATESDF